MKEFGNESGDPVLEFCEDWMLADEVTHVKMGSDWLRRLTEKDPGAPRACARVPAHGRQRSSTSAASAAKTTRTRSSSPAASASSPGFTDEENDSLAALARESTEEARQMAEMATATLDASGRESREPRQRHARSVHAHRVRRGGDRARSSKTRPRWCELPARRRHRARGRRGAVRAADRSHVRRRRRRSACCGSRAATSRTTAGRRTSRPTRPASISR